MDRVRVDFVVLDVVDRRHVLLVMLLVVLLLAQLLQLEHLQPALVAEEGGAELDHLSIDVVVWRDVSNELAVARLDIGDHLQVQLYTLLNLFERQAAQVDVWLVHVASKFVPKSPVLLLSLVDEVSDVLISAIS